MKTQIRRGTREDARAIARLLTQLGFPSDAACVPARLERFAAGGSAVALVATRGRHVLGLATVQLVPVLQRDRDLAWLTALVVEESARGTGVGRALVEAAVAFASEAGCERLSTTTQEACILAHGFYEAMGFERTGLRFGKSLT